uniref:Mannosyltransferase n=1 Tax=Hanusia phi TaxID=3032 RepID=A0A7S0E6U3_9CRYP|mmetsp:Transcript_16617/g.37946  ORF Transcript_16617/g.37946 Transcript_16617/m.37946 type:complete len:400 (+) Transcript_16617:741-1940(+)
MQVIAAMVGWPFVALLAVPMAILLLSSFRLTTLVLSSVKAVVIVLTPMMVVEFLMYGKVVLPTLQIVLYNVLGVGGDSTLYGTEEWWFYLANLTLNFNVAWPLCLLFPFLRLLVAITEQNAKTKDELFKSIILLSSAHLWIAFFSCLAHKEERFIFAVYPIIALSAGLSLCDISVLYLRLFPSTPVASGNNRTPSHRLRLDKVLQMLTLVVFLFVSFSRLLLAVKGFTAPFRVWDQVAYVQVPPSLKAPLKLCVGKEWYRFPSHFFVEGNWTTVRFIRSKFDGQLPGLFPESPDSLWGRVEGARSEDETFNSRNLQDESRLERAENCALLVDMATAHQQEDHYEEQEGWEIVYEEPFLDVASSRFPFKTFYLPWMFNRKNSFGRYVLLKNVKILPSSTG